LKAPQAIRTCDGRLAAVLRTLLVTDGTVTKSLEAFYWEPDRRRDESRRPSSGRKRTSSGSTSAGAKRSSPARAPAGRTSGVLYTQRQLAHPARSHSGDPARRLMAGSLGIGELIRDCGLETYRELLEIGVGGAMPASGTRRAGRRGAHPSHLPNRGAAGRTGDSSSRRYFPLAVFARSRNRRRADRQAPRYNYGMIRPFKGILPSVDASAYVDVSAQVIGDVHIGPESSLWMNVVVRGDVNSIRIGARSNVQDLTLVHVMRNTHPTVIGDQVTIGHSAVVHGCTIETGASSGWGRSC
jgi:hypothetical protein